MKVVCIKKFKSQGLQYELTYGKIYEVQPQKWKDAEIYFILCDKEYISPYNKSSFITLEEWREKQIDNILEL